MHQIFYTCCACLSYMCYVFFFCKRFLVQRCVFLSFAKVQSFLWFGIESLIIFKIFLNYNTKTIFLDLYKIF